MKNSIVQMLTLGLGLLASGCQSTTSVDEPVEWVIEEKAKPLHGCKELRKEIGHAKADC
jgi:hypothetical protein